MLTNRRIFVGASTGLFATTLLPRLAFGSENLPTPRFDYADDELRYTAGIRPYRNGSFRLEGEVIDDRLVVHNYGHGGAGITMSWGCALEVADMVTDWRSYRAMPSVAVLGAGAIGLTTATALRALGLSVTIYAKGFLGETTSSVAGGQFSPASVAYPAAGDGYGRFQRILRRSFLAHAERIGRGFGVVRRPNFFWGRSASMEHVPRDCIPEPQFFDRLPFEAHEASGYAYQTLLVEPPLFLRKMEEDLRLGGVNLYRRTFVDRTDMLSLTEDVIVNCTGLGAREVAGDSALVGIKGHLVWLPPQPELQYLYCDDRSTYIFPRGDAVIIGGNRERGVEDPTPNPANCREILVNAMANFGLS